MYRRIVPVNDLIEDLADVYVNTTNNQLNLSSGAVSKALLNAAGQSLQDECTKKAPVKTGNVAVTGPGKLPCKHVFHTVIPSYDGKASEKVLKSSIHTCLKECSSRGMISVAIPSIGTGNLHFPNDVVAKITVEEAITYLSSQKRGSLEFVHLVIFMDDTYKEFKKVLSSYGPQATLPTAADDDDDDSDDDSNGDEIGDSFPQPSMPLARVKKNRRLVGTRSTTLPSAASGISECLTLDIENIMVHLINGDITESTCDAIVNPTNPLMKLTGAGVAGTILKKGGPEQQGLCDAVIGAINKLDEGKVVHTKATGDLKCKFIFHINHEGRNVKKLSDVILACLDRAVNMHLTSIAFPAVGTGTNSCSPRESAASLIQAIRTYASSSSPKLQQIHVVLCEPQVLRDFHEVFKNPEEAQPSMLQRAFHSLYSFVTGGSSKPSADPKVIPVAEDISVCKQVEVNIYGETETAVGQAHHKVVSWIDEALSDREISSPYIQSLPETDEENLRKVCNMLHVEIDIDRESSRIYIKGNRVSVDKVHTAITESLNQFEKNLNKREHAKHMYEMVRWIRKEPGGLEGEEYDEIDNFEIEMAHRKGQASCTIGTSTDMYYYTIDFATGKETDHHTGVISEVERVDVLKQLQEGEKPSTWVKMPPNSSLHIVPLDSKSSEYAGVKQKFDLSMQGGYKQIVKIERIQNPALYLQFIGRKKEMDKHNPKGHQNERSLFHGTAVETCPKINQNGFNRSFAGKNATAYGKGVYFAKNASYSASGTYSPPDSNGHKYMYLVRALTGEFTRGDSSMIVPPYKDAAKFKEYDSVADNPSNPSIFVIFSDALVYPDYLITFE